MKRADKETLITLSEVCRITGTSKDMGKRALEDDNFEPIKGPHKAHFFPLFEAVRCLMKRKTAQSAVEQRNLADAKLKEAQRKKIEGEWRPITESRQLAARMAAITTEVIESSDLSLENQNKLIEQLKTSMTEGMEVGDD
jgi:hypothetical protein